MIQLVECHGAVSKDVMLHTLHAVLK